MDQVLSVARSKGAGWSGVSEAAGRSRHPIT